MVSARNSDRISGQQSGVKSAIHLISALLIAATVSACANYRPAPDNFNKDINSPYTLNAGDQIRVTVFDQDNLSNTYSVSQSGTIAFPLVGTVPARGKTVNQIETYLASKLASGYLRNPNVSVEVTTYRPIFIMGEVNDAGQYSYVPGMTAQKAIAAAGGFSARANQSDIDVTREINNKIITGRMSLTNPILPGDTIYVRERLF